jgi:hypothetical protein
VPCGEGLSAGLPAACGPLDPLGHPHRGGRLSSLRAKSGPLGDSLARSIACGQQAVCKVLHRRAAFAMIAVRPAILTSAENGGSRCEILGPMWSAIAEIPK